MKNWQREPESRGMRLVGHNDIDGRGDCMHVNVLNGHAFVGHMGETRLGTSILDISDPQHPHVVAQIDAPEGIHTHKVQVVDGVMLVNHEQYGQSTTGQGGLAVYDVSSPANPAQIGFLAMPGKGVHRMTWWGGRYAWATGSDDGYVDQFLIVVDVSDPSHPVEAGRWWYPGTWRAGGEAFTRPADRTHRLHHTLVEGDRAYLGHRDVGIVILDVSNPTQPTFVSELGFGDESRRTHTALPILSRNIVVVTDEATTDGCLDPHRRVRIVDIADEHFPKLIATLPVPDGNFCERGGRFGPHNLHEHRPGSMQDSDRIYVTYFNAGVRVYDISDPTQPSEIAFYIPAAPAGRSSIQMNDLTVTPDGLIWATDRHAGGLYVLELDPAVG